MKKVSLFFWKLLAPLCDLSKSYFRISVNESDLLVNQLCKNSLKVWIVCLRCIPRPHLHDNCLLKDLMWFRARAEFLEESMNLKICCTTNSPREIWAVDYSQHMILFFYSSFFPVSALYSSLHFSSVCLSVNLSESWWRALLNKDQMLSAT